MSIVIDPVNSSISGATNTVPAGAIIAWAGATAPTGYLQCPTSVTNVSRTTYADLFAAIGTTWGVGNGTTTFGIPFFPADYSMVQSAANVGTQSTGQNLSHTHPVNFQTGTGVASYDFLGLTNNVFGNTASTASSGGTANLAAGSRTMFCVKY